MSAFYLQVVKKNARGLLVPTGDLFSCDDVSSDVPVDSSFGSAFASDLLLSARSFKGHIIPSGAVWTKVGANAKNDSPAPEVPSPEVPPLLPSPPIETPVKVTDGKVTEQQLPEETTPKQVFTQNWLGQSRAQDQDQEQNDHYEHEQDQDDDRNLDQDSSTFPRRVNRRLVFDGEKLVVKDSNVAKDCDRRRLVFNDDIETGMFEDAEEEEEAPITQESTRTTFSVAASTIVSTSVTSVSAPTPNVSAPKSHSKTAKEKSTEQATEEDAKKDTNSNNDDFEPVKSRAKSEFCETCQVVKPYRPSMRYCSDCYQAQPFCRIPNCTRRSTFSSGMCPPCYNEFKKVCIRCEVKFAWHDSGICPACFHQSKIQEQEQAQHRAPQKCKSTWQEHGKEVQCSQMTSANHMYCSDCSDWYLNNRNCF